MSARMAEKVKAVLKEWEPVLARHAGGAEFVGCRGGIVMLRMRGACKGCPLAGLTLKEGLESALRERVKGVKAVRAVE